MKTLNEIKEEVAYSIEGCSWEEYRKNHIISERTLERVAHLFAREALDAAAESATLWVETPINGTEFDKLEEDLAREDDTESYPQVTTVFKDSILKIKDQLK